MTKLEVSDRTDRTDTELDADIDATPVLSVRNLSKIYEPSPPGLRLLIKSSIDEPVAALTDCSFDVHAGKICVVVGPNGAGKSTLFRILTGLTTATSGSATILGLDISEGQRVRALLGFMPAEDRNLMLRHTCRQNLEFRGRLQGIARVELDDRIEEVLMLVGLGHRAGQAASSLSTGMKARLQLAAAILHRPRLLILDEPTSAVDPVGAHELLTLIQDLATTNQMSVVLSSHRLEEIDALEDQVVFLDQGRVIHNGDLGELRSQWETPEHRIQFMSADAAAAGASVLGDAFPDSHIRIDGDSVQLAATMSLGEIIAALGSVTADIQAIERVTMPLRTLFSQLLNGELGVSASV